MTKHVTNVTTIVTNPADTRTKGPTKQGPQDFPNRFRFHGIKSPHGNQTDSINEILNEIRAMNAHNDWIDSQMEEVPI